VVFLVRHAEKASDAKDALLSEVGQRRAEYLAHFLKDADIRKILVTRVVRTKQTAEPLAKILGLKPTVPDADDIDAFVKNLRAEPNANVLVVGHSDTIPKIIEQLGGGKIASIEASEYDKMFVLYPDGKRRSVVTLRYCDCKVSQRLNVVSAIRVVSRRVRPLPLREVISGHLSELHHHFSALCAYAACEVRLSCSCSLSR
jgi:phosphohistidine phosphatase SixA